ncbi:hypothetical protein Ct61P_05691 [Colletotrichum tofieldiae]|nr:hypothetical protein Ct61P_05691 [Colletotrichum tofieldiae]
MALPNSSIAQISPAHRRCSSTRLPATPFRHPAWQGVAWPEGTSDVRGAEDSVTSLFGEAMLLEAWQDLIGEATARPDPGPPFLPPGLPTPLCRAVQRRGGSKDA